MQNTLTDIRAYRDLVQGGGRQTVPCLRIEREGGNVEWMYESADIIRFIDENKNEFS